MNRDEKVTAVEEIATQLAESDAVFAIDYRGISVPQAAELRGKLRELDTSFRVSKNRLAKLAAAKAGQEGLNDVLTGPTALTFVKGDVAAAAKTITSFTREHDVLTFKGGLLGDLYLDEDRFKAIAQLPGRDALNAQLAGVVASPITGLVRGLGSMISGLAIALGQVAEQGLVGQGAPAPAAEEASAEGTLAEEAPAAESEGSGDSKEATRSEPEPDGSGREAEQPSVDETPNPGEEPSADGSSATSPEAEPTKDESEPEAEPEPEAETESEAEPEPEAAVDSTETSQDSEDEQE